MQEARWGGRRPDPTAAQASHGTPTRMDPPAARPRLERHLPASQASWEPIDQPAAPQRPARTAPGLLVASARTAIPTTRPRRPALRAGRAAGLKFAGPTAAALTQPALRTQVSPSGHPSVRSRASPPGPPSPDPLSRFSSTLACPAAHRESHTRLHFSGPRIAAAIYIPRDLQNSSQHRFPIALARSRIIRIEDTFRNFIASVCFRNIRIYSGLYPLPVS
jgi:hypothetical protein